MFSSLSFLVINGPSRGYSVPFNKGRTLLGRAGAEGANGSAEHFLDLQSIDADERISRRHARVHFTDESVTIEDLGSLNGTIINRGAPLVAEHQQPLQDGDEVMLGGTVFTVELKRA